MVNLIKRITTVLLFSTLIISAGCDADVNNEISIGDNSGFESGETQHSNGHHSEEHQHEDNHQ